MKLSQNMLNFLGYMIEQEEGFGLPVDTRTATALAYPFGIQSATFNDLITESGRRGFVLTEFGRQVAAIGRDMRRDTRPNDLADRQDFVKRGQEIIDNALKPRRIS